MAITLISSPDTFQPAYNPIEFKFVSDNVATCDFKYIADIFVNGVFAVRLKIFPEISNNQGYVRVERILQDFLSYKFSTVTGGGVGVSYLPTVAGFQTLDNHLISYTIQMREQYNGANDCLGSVVTSSVLYTSGTFYCWNGALNRDSYFSYDQYQYLANDNDSRFLTNRPIATTTLIKSNTGTLLSFLHTNANAPTGVVTQAIVELYDSRHVYLATNTVANTYLANTTLNKCLVFNLIPSTLTSFNDNTKFIVVYLADASSVRITEAFVFEIDTRCTKYQKNNLYWLNPLGGWDNYHFDLVSNRSLDIKRDQYEKNTSQTLLRPFDRGNTITSVNSVDKWTLTSNWMTENESKWLGDLFTSPEVYMDQKEIFSTTYSTAYGGAYLSFDFSLFNAYEFVVGSKITYQTNSLHYTIDADLWNGGFLDISIPESIANPIDIGTFFNYTIRNGAVFGIPNAGTGTIVSMSAPGLWHTDIPCPINPMAGYITIGTFDAVQTINGLEYGSMITDTFTTGTINAGEKVNISASQLGTASVVNGHMGGTLEIELTKMIPVVLTDTNFKPKVKDNIRNINHTVELQRAYKKNIQNQ